MKYATTVTTEHILAIMGIDEFRTLSYQDRIPNRDKLAVICIHDPDKPIHDTIYTNGFADVLQMQFWDIEASLGDMETITPEQGLEIVEFIIKNKDKQFFIHCSAGISRSAGTGKAVEALKLFSESDNIFYDYATCYSSGIDAHYRYSPNGKVFRTIIEAFQNKGIK